jgi:hypothetical protein
VIMTTMVEVPLRAVTAITGSHRCLRCARPLRDPISVARGVGPECRTKIDPRWRDAAELRVMTAIWRAFRA